VTLTDHRTAMLTTRRIVKWKAHRTAMLTFHRTGRWRDHRIVTSRHHHIVKWTNLRIAKWTSRHPEMYSGFAAKFASLEFLVLSSRRSLKRLFVKPNAPDQKRVEAMPRTETKGPRLLHLDVGLTRCLGVMGSTEKSQFDMIPASFQLGKS
jgi:hypothetical protein